MTGRRWFWKALAYIALAALCNVIYASDLSDGTEVVELLTFGAFAFAGEAWFELRGRRRRNHVHPAPPTIPVQTLTPPCAGPHSVTNWDCNGDPMTEETCSPVGTSLESHLAAHKAAVLAKARANNCA